MAQRVWILGDSPLVEEYAALCVERGLETKVRINPDEFTRALPRGTKHYDEAERDVDLVFELTNISPDMKRRNLAQLDGIVNTSVPIVSSSVTVTMAEQVTWLRYPFRVIGIGALPSLTHGSVVEFTLSALTDKATRTRLEEFANLIEKKPVFVSDSIGMVMPRILCSIVNEACFAMMEGVATARDIDTAMKLGTNYPRGPVDWGEHMNPRHVHAVMSALHKYFGEDRYRPAPLLLKAALKNSFL